MHDSSPFSDPLTVSMLDSLHEGVVVWGRDMRLLYANKAARQITGLKMEPGTPLPPIVESLHVLTDMAETRVQNAALPVYRAFAGESVPRETIRLIQPNGIHKWLSVTADRVLDEKNELAYVVSSFRDISLRKSREDKLNFMVESAKILSLQLDFKQRLAEKAKLTVPSLADWCAIDVLDESGNLERVTSIHRDPVILKKMNDMVAAYPRDTMRSDSIMQIIKMQTPYLVKVVSEDDLKRWSTSPEHLETYRSLNIKSLMTLPISTGGRGMGAMTLAYCESGRTYDENDLEFFQEFCYHLSVIFDNARLFDEIKKRDEAKDVFLASLSHELRNPLAPIKSALELIQMRQLTPEIREEIDIIEHQFNHMARLLNDLLDVTRFTQDRISLSTQPVDLRRLTERALKAADPLMRSADITLHFTFSSNPLTIIADETRLEQAISNLISNAVKFTPAGGSIWVELERDGTDACIRVRDNGAGIEAYDLPNIFDIYYQGSNRGAANTGLGLGLLLVRRIVELHRGSVTARSEGRGKGAEFTIKIPLVELTPSEKTDGPLKGAAKAMRILIVDDNVAAADALVRLLNKLGSNAQAVYSGRDALGVPSLDTVDAFLLDVGMPEMDGYALVRALRDRGITAPIIALTGYGLAEDKKRAESAGFTTHLTKPIGIRDLTTALDEVLA